MTTILKRISGGVLAAAFALASGIAASSPARAQDYAPGAPGVANVSLTQGDVVIVRGDNGAQFGAAINAPLLPGDYISTASQSRAEVQFDGISMLRLAHDTQVRFVSLAPQSREMQLASGTVELAELQNADGNPLIDTPSVTVRPDTRGVFRVTVQPNGQTLVTVRSGRATVSSQNGSQNVGAGSTLVAWGPYSNASMSFGPTVAWDAFDNFNQQRDEAIVASYNSTPYLSPELAGYTNFSNYGRWYDVPGYGESWAPYDQANNWTPYSNGQWMWEPGYGYTWVGNEPWGYAPYHYGNWYYAQNYNQWMWQPPAYQYQNSAGALASAWLPALVAFFLTGGNAGAAFGNGYGYNPASPYGYGNVSWVPLAPGEQYSPWYAGFGPNAAYPQPTVTNVTNVTNVYKVYRNMRYLRVVRVIPVTRFRNGQFTPVVMRAAQLRNVAIVRGALPIVPTAALTRIASAPAVAHPVVLATAFHQTHFAQRQPVIGVVPFHQQVTRLQETVAKPPRVAPLAETHAAVARPAPVYRAPAEHRAPIAPPAMQQRATAAPEQRFATPQPRPAVPVPARPQEPASRPEPVHTMVPLERPTERPVAPRPTERPAIERVTPVRPEPAPAHTIAPAERPTERPAAPERPAATRPAPAIERVTPVRPEPAPAHTLAPAERPVEHPVPAATQTPPTKKRAPVPSPSPHPGG